MIEAIARGGVMGGESASGGRAVVVVGISGRANATLELIDDRPLLGGRIGGGCGGAAK